MNGTRLILEEMNWFLETEYTCLILRRSTYICSLEFLEEDEEHSFQEIHSFEVLIVNVSPVAQLLRKIFAYAKDTKTLLWT